MPIRRLSLAVSPILSVVDWIFSAAAPGIDLVLGAWASCWFGMMMLRPEVFDRGSFTGLQWAPDWVWIVFVATVVVLHLAGLLMPEFSKLRVTAGLLSAWYWIVVSVSLTRYGLVPGTWTYGIIGTVGLAGAIYINGRALRNRVT